MTAPSLARLASVPWRALDGLGPALQPPLERVLQGAAAERELDRLLRANRAFSADQRRVCAEALFGVGLWRRRLAARAPAASALHWLAVLAHEGGFDGAPAALGVEPPDFRPLPDDWRIRWSFPDWIADVLVQRFGDDAEACAEAMNRPGPITLRARGDRAALAAQLAHAGLETRPGTLASQALIVTSERPNLYGLPPQFLGRFEVQDEGSQLLGELLELEEGAQVLDVCAGAGGKSLQLAALVGPQGRVHAADLDFERLERLRTRASKAGVTIAIHGQVFPETLRAEAVLVDAPCSELGALRRGPDLRWRVHQPDVQRWVPVQREVLLRGLHHLLPGGRLVYATCTFTTDENEAVVAQALRADSSVTVERQVVLAPHAQGTDGFFAAVLRKRK